MKGGWLGVKAGCDEKSKMLVSRGGSRRGWRCRHPADGILPAASVVCQEAGKWWALGCAALLPHCPHHPLRIGVVLSLLVWLSGIRCWDCNPSIASQGEIALMVKSTENSQVTCNLIQFGKGEQSPEVSRLEVGWSGMFTIFTGKLRFLRVLFSLLVAVFTTCV